MKQGIFTALLLIAGIFMLPVGGMAQYFKATSYSGSTSTSLTITLKPDFNFSDKLNEVGFAIQIPKSVGGSPVPLPTITVLNNFLSTTFSTWSQQSESVSDPDFYNFKLGATAVGSAPVLNVNNGVELQVIEIQISAPVGAISQTRLAHLAAGGPSSQYGVAFIDGSLNDRTNYVQMFYGNGVVPAIPAPDELTGYNTYQYVLPSGTVPVRFLAFDVIEKDNGAWLTWLVENESALTDRYEVERSIDGHRFDKIATVLPTAATSDRKNYQLTDMELKTLKASGRIYYRIRQVDNDDRFVYTEIRSLLLSSSSPDITIFPNPTSDNCQIRFSMQKTDMVTITVTDAVGRIMNRKMTTYPAGINQFTINSKGWSSGLYHVKVEYDKEVRILSFIKRSSE